jgi:hypothetical protein
MKKAVFCLALFVIASYSWSEEWLLTKVFDVPEEVVTIAFGIVFPNRIITKADETPDSPVTNLQIAMMNRFVELQQTSPFPEAKICLWAGILAEMYIGIVDSRADSNTLLKMYLNRLQPYFTEADRVFYRLMNIF